MRLLAASLALLVVGAARAACPPSCPLPGGGTVRQDCHAEFASTAMRLNYPPFDPGRPRPAKEVRCFDGEPGCDVDGVVNGECAFPIDVCLLKDPDPALSACTAATVTGVEVPGSKRSADLTALADALFNGAPGFAGHRIFATLYDGGTANYPAGSDHLFAFDDLDGTVDWSAPLGASWSGVAVANGLVFAGSNTTAALFVHDASTGALLNTLVLPATTASGAAVVDGVVYVGYGIINANGGVVAFGLP